MKKFLVRLLAMSIGATIGVLGAKGFMALLDILWEITNGSTTAIEIIVVGGIVLIACVLCSVGEWFIARKIKEVEDER